MEENIPWHTTTRIIDGVQSVSFTAVGSVGVYERT